jgi:hypothetical protein
MDAMKDRHLAAIGIGLLVASLYIAAIGIGGSMGGYVRTDDALGYGVAVFAAAAIGAWLVLGIGHRRDGPR